MPEPVIRPFRPDDTDACYEVCVRTAHHGRDATHLHSDPRLPGEIWVGPYLALFPELALVVEDAGGVGGYILGAADTATYDRLAEETWFPPLRGRYPRGTFPQGTADGDCENFVHSPPVMPVEIVESHPAHLHIDLLPRLQRQGLGRRLVDEFLALVRAAGADALHLGCSPENADAIAFYRRLGFEDLLAGFVWGRSTEPLSS